MNPKLSLYIFKIQDFSDADAARILSPAELLRFSKIQSQKRRQDFVNSRLLIKTVLSTYCGIANPAIRLKKNGKPYVKGIKFNLSHSGSRVILAVHPTFELGVDIEQSGKKTFFLQIAKQYFSLEENQYINKGRTTDQKFQRFAAIWTLKESFIKAVTGELTKNALATSFDLDRLSFKRVGKGKTFSIFYDKKWGIALSIAGNLSLKDINVFALKLSSDSGKTFVKKKLVSKFKALHPAL